MSKPSSNAPRRPGARARRERRAPEGPTRERILAAALEVFAQHGFDGARTREIADRAGANLGLLAYYFGDKETLWRAALAGAFGELSAEIAALRARAQRESAADERAQLEAFLRGVVRFLAKRPAFMRLMNDESRRDGPRMRWLVDHHVKPAAAAMSAVAKRAQVHGLLPAIPPFSLHYIVLGAAGLVFSQAPECRRLMGVDPCDEAAAEAHADALVRVLLGP